MAKFPVEDSLCASRVPLTFEEYLYEIFLPYRHLGYKYRDDSTDDPPDPTALHVFERWANEYRKLNKPVALGWIKE